MRKSHSSRRPLPVVAAALALVTSLARADGPGLAVSTTPDAGSFALVTDAAVATVRVDAKDAKVVRIAADLFAADVRRVTGRTPSVETGDAKAAGPTVIVGTLGGSSAIDALVTAGKLDVSAVRGKWEAYQLAVVKEPSPGAADALVVVGSDRRGTAFGVMALSEAIGVSPWYWWADVPPLKRATLHVRFPSTIVDAPAVKYRGIFINDEDWGLRPWAAKTFDPTFGNIGPKTYEKVFELMLRLRANLLWPAMHPGHGGSPGSTEFGSVDENIKLADDWAIVMGASHAEPMNRNNVWYDQKANGPWRYDTNRDAIKKYWEEWAKNRGAFDAMWTVGLRGIHDSGMQGPKDTPSRVKLVEQAIVDQRELLAKYAGRPAEQIAQAFVPYKEVLTLYRAGLKVPGDVTLVWPDDNHGYVRQLSSPDEQKRSGGAGVYYHISYWGVPEDYLWLNTTPPALMWEEMSKAYDNNARTAWVVNVGDIKPGEVGMDFFLRLAWNPAAWGADGQMKFLTDWATRTFGPDHAADIAAVMDEYYRLNFGAKPEHLAASKYYQSGTAPAGRAERFAKLVEKVNALEAAAAADQRDALFQLVVYPVRTAAAMHERWRSTDPARALAAWESIQNDTRTYNETISNGKWRGMMSANPRGLSVFAKPGAKPTTTPASMPAKARPADIVIEAERPTRRTDANGATWQVIDGLGVSGDSIALRPAVPLAAYTAKLEYDVDVARGGAATIRVRCLPTHMVHSGLSVRYAISIDGQPEQTVDLETAEFSKPWSANVLRGSAIGTTPADLTVGRHTITLRPLDPGLVFDMIEIDLAP